MLVKNNIDTQKSLSSITDEILFCLYTIGYLILTLLPAIKYSVPYIFAGTYCLVPIAMYYLRFPEFRDTITFITLAGLICGLLTYLLDNGGANSIVNIPIDYLRYFLPCILFVNSFKVSDLSRKIIWTVAAIIMIFVTIKTSNALNDDPMIARILAIGDLEKKYADYRMQNVAGFGFCYAVGFIFPLCVSTVTETSNKIIKTLAVISAISIFLFVLKTQYMILLLLCVFTVILSVIYGQKNVFFKLIGCTFVVFFILALPKLLTVLNSFNLGNIIFGKISRTINFLNGSVAAEETTSRTELYKAALMEFLRSPLWGTLKSKSAAECHSTVFGIGCTTGIIGLSSYAYLLFANYNTVTFKLKQNGLVKTPFIIAFFAFVILAMFNPVEYTYEISVVVFLLIPITICLLYDKNKEKKDEKLGT